MDKTTNVNEYLDGIWFEKMCGLSGRSVEVFMLKESYVKMIEGIDLNADIPNYTMGATCVSGEHWFDESAKSNTDREI